MTQSIMTLSIMTSSTMTSSTITSSIMIHSITILRIMTVGTMGLNAIFHTQHNDTQYNGIQHNDSQYKYTQHADTLHQWQASYLRARVEPTQVELLMEICSNGRLLTLAVIIGLCWKDDECWYGVCCYGCYGCYGECHYVCVMMSLLC